MLTENHLSEDSSLKSGKNSFHRKFEFFALQKPAIVKRKLVFLHNSAMTLFV